MFQSTEWRIDQAIKVEHRIQNKETVEQTHNCLCNNTLMLANFVFDASVAALQAMVPKKLCGGAAEQDKENAGPAHTDERLKKERQLGEEIQKQLESGKWPKKNVVQHLVADPVLNEVQPRSQGCEPSRLKCSCRKGKGGVAFELHC